MKKRITIILFFLIFTSITTAQEQINVNIDTADSRDIPKELHGVNQNWFKSLKLQTNLITEGVNDIKFTHIRFPGGTVSNYYNWKTYYPNWNRFEVDWNETISVIAIKNFYNIHVKSLKGDDFINYADSLGKDVVFVANVHNSMNFDYMVESLQTLSDLDINIKYLEIGNELYFPQYGMDNDTYLSRAKRLSQEARAVFPNVKTAIIINRIAWKGVEKKIDIEWSIPNENWYDAVIVHAYLDDGSALWDTNKDEFLYGTLYEVNNKIKNMVVHIKEKYPGKEIWITEWNYFNSTGERKFANTYKNTFHAYNFMLNMLKYPEITLANYHALSQQSSGNTIITLPTRTLFSIFYPLMSIGDDYFKAVKIPLPEDHSYTFDTFFVRASTYWPLTWIGEMFSEYDDYTIFNYINQNNEEILGVYFFNQNNPNSGSIAVINKKNEPVKINFEGLNIGGNKLVHKFMNDSWDKISEEGSELNFKTKLVNKDNLVLPAYSISYIDIQPYLFGDINNDGDITLDDVLDLIMNYNDETSNPDLDLNQDGKINLFDLVIVAKNMI